VRRAAAIAFFALMGVIALGLATLVLMLATSTLEPYALSTTAMEPTLRADERVLALTRFVSYERGDVVVFRASTRAEARCGIAGEYVKRVIGLAGESVEIRSDGAVYVDGRRLDEPYAEEQREPGVERRFVVPAGSVLVLGDNRARSCDSRAFGPVAEDALLGRVVATYWPPDRISIR
jgi:signal peptidase I